jgi:hypothetical protein
MVTEIGEVLAVLQSRGVLDYSTSHEVDLLHKEAAVLRFDRTELLEVKRFTTLFRNSSRAFSYLVGHPQTEIERTISLRTDRIMGAVAIPETVKAQDQGRKAVACVELSRNINTAANRLLCRTLLAAMLFCDAYLARNGSLLRDPSGQLDVPTLQDLRVIRLFVSQLVSTRFVRRIMESEGFSTDISGADLGLLRYLALSERIPRAYYTLIEFFERWRDFIWVAWTQDAVQHGLRYHFFSLDDENKLYESWVCFKILRAITDRYSIVLKERNSRTGILFRGESGIGVRYQRRFPTGWEFGGEQGEAIPDVIIDFAGEVKLVVDAKNTGWNRKLPDIYRRQVGEYLNLTGCKLGVLLHSVGPSMVWERMRKPESEQEINWTPLTPGEKENTLTLARVLDLIH